VSRQLERVIETMRQTYDVIGGPTVARASLPLLRAVMKAGGIDGVYIPHDDEYQNEYLPDCAERLAWATGFTGSAGAAFVFMKSAIVFVDGRYTLQAKVQLAPKIFETGAIGFVGLIVPHLMRPLVGHSPSRLLLASALCGGLLLTVADIVVRVITPGSELRLGVATALIGAPFFIYLVLKARTELES
jgi:hypothetical protein